MELPPDSRRLPPTPIIAAIGAGAVLIGVLFAAVVAPMFGSGGSQPGSAVGPSAVPGSTSASASAPGSVPPPGSPVAPSASAPTVVGTPKPAADVLPIRGSALELGTQIHMVTGPVGGLYVTIPKGETETVVVLLEADGTPRPGWPVVLQTGYCSTLLIADDGSVRVLCDAPSEDDGLQAPMTRIFALDDAGRVLPGWPVDVESVASARMRSNDLTLLVRPYLGDTPETDSELVHVVVVSREGDVRTGSDIEFPCCQTSFTLGPDGTGYLTNHLEGTPVTTEITALGLAGERAGWPVILEGKASDVTIDKDGQVHAIVAGPRTQASRTVVYDAAGHPLGGSGVLSISSTNPWAGPAGDANYPGAPLVGDNRTTFILSADGGTSILALDPAGKPMNGWPFRSKVGMQNAGSCEGDTGCGLFRTAPRIGNDDVLYIALQSAGSSVGGSLLAIDVNGRVRDGWPVGLRRAGSTFWSIEAGPSGAWALAIEPEARGYSATILSIADDSTVLYAKTVLQP